MFGYVHRLDDQTCAQLGTVAATYALEHLGGQSHTYTAQDFKRRYEDHFGPLQL